MSLAIIARFKISDNHARLVFTGRLKEAELGRKEADLDLKEAEFGSKEVELDLKEAKLVLKEAELGPKEVELDLKGAELGLKEAELGVKEAGFPGGAENRSIEKWDSKKLLNPTYVNC